MFNGIIFYTGVVKNIKKNKESIYIGIQTKLNLNRKDLGTSISCDGVCLTVEKKLKLNQIINLEKSLSFGQNVSGHFIQGHVDTVAKIEKIRIIDKTWIIKFKILNKKLKRFLVEKASISINGVSLTLSRVYQNFFEINIIPHTLKLTNLRDLKVNKLVNVELDILSKYMYKYHN